MLIMWTVYKVVHFRYHKTLWWNVTNHIPNPLNGKPNSGIIGSVSCIIYDTLHNLWWPVRPPRAPATTNLWPGKLQTFPDRLIYAFRADGGALNQDWDVFECLQSTRTEVNLIKTQSLTFNGIMLDKYRLRDT